MLLPCAITERNVQNAFAPIHWCTDGIGKRYEWKWTIRREETIRRGGTIGRCRQAQVEYLKGAN